MTQTLRRFVLRLLPVALLGVFVVPSSLSSSSAPSAGTALAANPVQTKVTAATALSHTALAFEPNRGQAPASVRYLAHGPGYTLYLAASGAYLSLSKETGMPQPQRALNPFAKTVLPASPARTRTALLGFLPQRMASHVTMTATDKLPGIVNYFIGNKPSQWHTDIPTYGRVTYHNVYPHIDLVFYGNGTRPEYDWVVRPGGNPAMIRLHVTGTSGLSLGPRGELSMGTRYGAIVQDRPRIRQAWSIPGAFMLGRGNLVTLRIGRYDPTKPLIIDPAFALGYSTFFGQASSPTDPNGARVLGMAVDSTGAAYVAGSIDSDTLPSCGTFPKCVFPNRAIEGTFMGSGPPNVVTEGFVSKLDPTGTQLLYSTYFGGSGGALAYRIALDATDDAYVVGDAGQGFPTCGSFAACASPGSAIQPSLAQGAFVSKLSPDGAQLLYSTYLGGTTAPSSPAYAIAYAVAVNSAGDAYVTGVTDTTDFPVCGSFAKCATHTAIQESQPGAQSAFVTEINPLGTQLLYSTYLGGSGDDTAYGIAVDSTGAAYVAGVTMSTDFPVCGSFPKCSQPGTGILPFYDRGYDEAFVSKIDPTGSYLVYSTYLGADDLNGHGTRRDVANGVAVDHAGDAYVVGESWDASFATCGSFAKCESPGTAIQPAFSGTLDAFAVKLNAAGTQFVYSTYLGGSQQALAQAVAVDGTGESSVLGSTNSSDFPTCGSFSKCAYPGTSLVSSTGAPLFISTLNSSGTQLLASSVFGYVPLPFAITVDRWNNIYIGGMVSSSDYPVCGNSAFCLTPGTAIQATNPDNNSAFITKIVHDPFIVPSVSGTQGNFGWYRGDVHVSWTVTDPAASIESESGCSPVTITTDTAGRTLICSATAGGSSNAQAVTVRRDAVPPNIAVTSVSAGPPRSATLTIRDATSGLASITVLRSVNCTITGTSGFPSDTTAPVQIVAARLNNAQYCSLAIRATDVAGNASTLDPAILLSAVGPQSPATDRLTGVAGTDSQVTVVNGTPGMQTLMILVNGHLFPLTRLQNGETRVVDVSSAMHTGTTNSVIVLGTGGPGASAAVLLGPPSGSS